MSFFNELKRRNVVKVAITYAIIAWLLLQVIDVVLPNLGAPQWVLSTLMVLILLGFPVAIVIAWAFQVTPEGIKSQQAADNANLPATGMKPNTLLILSLILAVGFIAMDALLLTGDNDQQEPMTDAGNGDQAAGAPEVDITVAEKSIAVLPFANLSNDPDQDYFADGLAEELLNRLARVQDLLVAGRTSSFYFKDRNESMAEIGRQLGVAHILEGSVRKAGNQVRVSAQLLRADNGFQLWSDTYDRDLEDIFMIQDEISEAVTTALSVTLGAGEFDRPGMTTNVQAYEAFLRADPASNPEPEKTLETIAHLENAVMIDPDFGIAWNALYRAYEFATISLPPDLSAEFVPLTVPALERAQTLMPGSPEVLVSSAISQRRMGNFIEAEQLFLTSITQYGNSDAAANLNYGELLWSVGRMTDAIPYLERARRLDPKQADISARLGGTLIGTGRFDEAREEIQRGIDINPTNGFVSSLMGILQMAEGNIRELLDNMPARSPFGEPGDVAGSVLRTYLDGEEARARQMLREYSEGKVFSPVIATVIGPVAAIIGDDQLALSMYAGVLDTNTTDAFGSFSTWLNYMSGMRQLDGFKDLAEKGGLVNYWRTTGNWADLCQPIEGTDDFACI